MTLLVILGAGASYDCAPWLDAYEREAHVREGLSKVSLTTKSARPPLTHQLFDSRDAFAQFVADYSSVRPLIDTLRSAYHEATALEDQLGDYEQDAEQHLAKLYHLMAMRFYLRDVLLLCSDAMLSIGADAGITNHIGLVNTLHRWASSRDEHVCCVSFNYDTLLEQACQDVWRFNPNLLQNYVGDPLFSIIKPHGSVTWERPFTRLPGGQSNRPSRTRLERARLAIDAAPREADFSLDPIRVRDPLPSGAVSVPVLAPPLRTKSHFAWPDEQSRHFESLWGKVTRLVIIGWRAAEPHFTERLTPTFEGLALRTLIVTAGHEAESQARGIAHNVGLDPEGRNISYHTNGFSDLISSGALGQWLNSQ